MTATSRRCDAPACSLRNIAIRTERTSCLGCGADLKDDVEDLMRRIMGDGWPLR